MESDGIHEGFTIQILSNPMESDGIHEGFTIQLLSNPMESDGIHEGFTIHILSNPMESEGIHEVLQSKPYQIQWNLMGFMRFLDPNLIKPIRFDT